MEDYDEGKTVVGGRLPNTYHPAQQNGCLLVWQSAQHPPLRGGHDPPKQPVTFAEIPSMVLRTARTSHERPVFARVDQRDASRRIPLPQGDFAHRPQRDGQTDCLSTWTGEGTKAGEAWRTRVIFETNVRTSHAAGRYRELTDPYTLRAMPYWRYVHSDSVLHPRPQHLAWHGLTLRHDHQFWQSNFPPNGWGCQCRIVAVRAPRKGDPTEPPAGWDVRDDKGNLPGIDRGWDYAPGANAATPLRELIEQKLIKLDAGVGAVMWEALQPALLAEQARDFAAWADALTVPRGEFKTVGALSGVTIAKLAERGREPGTAALAVRDEDVLHTHRDTKTGALPWAWYRELPLHLAAPRAVLLDKTDPEGALLLVFDVNGETGKLVVKIDYEITVRGEDGTKRPRKANIVRSGKLMDPNALRDQLSYEVLDGEI